MSKKVELRDQKILDNWSVLIKDAHGKAEEIFRETLKSIEESGVPGVKTETVSAVAVPTFFGHVSPLWKRDKRYEERKYILVKNDILKDFRMYIGARDYGKNLDVSWYLTCEPGILKSWVSALVYKSEKALSFALNVFQQQDLAAYVTCIHHCLLEAVESLMRGLNQDPSKIDRKSKGFLGVS
jgi:hypothetical protein